MPLVRVQVRNEFGLGKPELYSADSAREDPKAVLDGVAVAGLVGILRQLGDLAEFAAEVFHGLQEQVMITSSRSHKIMCRVQKVETALPPIEKAALAQSSHIHFAYTSGCEWHARIRNEKNHFIYNDLPRFIMDNYEECRDPPRLHLLDKFDTGGPGSCLKRYSDPTFFKRVSVGYDEAHAGKMQKEKKAKKNKKRRSRKRNGEVSHNASISTQSGRLGCASLNFKGQASAPHTGSIFDIKSEHKQRIKSNSFDSKSGSANIERVLHSSSSLRPEEIESLELPSSRLKMQNHESLTLSEEERPVELPSSRLNMQNCGSMVELEDEEPVELSSSGKKMWNSNNYDSTILSERNGAGNEGYTSSSLQGRRIAAASFVRWDEKTEILELKGELHDSGSFLDLHPADNSLKATEKRSEENANLVNILYGAENIKDIVGTNNQEPCTDSPPEMLATDFDLDETEIVPSVTSADFYNDIEDPQKSLSVIDPPYEIESETDNYMDALNTIESESESDLDCQPKTEVKQVHSETDDSGRDQKMQVISMNSSDQSPELEYLSEPCTFPPCEMPSILAIVASAENEQSAEIVGQPTDQDNSQILTICDGSGNPDSLICESTPNSPSSSSSTTCNSLSRGDQNILSSSPVDICENSRNSDCSKYEPLGSNPPPSSMKDSTSLSPSQNEIVASPPVADICETARNISFLDFRSVNRDSSSYESTSETSAVSGDKLSCESRETFENFQAVQSVMFWTNGGLLGLEPSKPPVLSAMNAGRVEPDRKTSALENQTVILKSNKHTQPVLFDDIQADNASTRTSLVNPSAKVDSVITLPELSDAPDFKTTPAAQESDVYSLHRYGSDNGIRANGFQRNMSIIDDQKAEKPAPASEYRANAIACQTSSVMISSDDYGHESVVDSPSCSPPLEHMKISFHPSDSFDNSKLKLRFPDRSECHENVDNIFASFQLVPELSILSQEMDSESGDDTFCRSSPCMSDDYVSHQTESDSEQWESGEILGSQDHELYNSFNRTSSMDFIPSSLDLEELAHDSTQIDSGREFSCTGIGKEPPLYGHLLEFSSINFLGKQLPQEFQEVSDLKDFVGPQKHAESTPVPPPLPPVQTQFTKFQSDVREGRQGDALTLRVPESSISQQPVPASAKQHDMTENGSTVIKMKNETDQQKLNKQEISQIANGKEINERNDFLQQIKNKSFNLRRTATVPANYLQGPTTNFKVTAILEKANAIRQAVGSDDGEDEDNWSDT